MLKQNSAQNKTFEMTKELGRKEVTVSVRFISELRLVVMNKYAKQEVTTVTGSPSGNFIE